MFVKSAIAAVFVNIINAEEQIPKQVAAFKEVCSPCKDQMAASCAKHLKRDPKACAHMVGYMYGVAKCYKSCPESACNRCHRRVQKAKLAAEKKAAAAKAKAAAAAAAKAKKANYSDDSFLMGGLDSFNEAEERRARYVAEHMSLVKARYTKAKIYFKAKDTAALKVRIEGEWNTKWLAAVKKHDDAIAKHEHAKKATIEAMTKKRNAIHAKLQASEAATQAEALKLHALGNWNASKLASGKATHAHKKAVKAHNTASAHEDKMAKELEDAEAHQAAMKDEFELREKNHDGALATEKEAAAKEAEAKKAHKAAVAAQAHADAEERVAARARSAALSSYKQAQTEKTEAVNMKAAALARAIAAGRAVRAHTQTNGMFAL